MTDQASNDDVPQQIVLQGSMTDERSHFYTLDAAREPPADRTLPQTGARPKTTNRPRSPSPTSDAPFTVPGSPKYEKPQKTRTNSRNARVEPTGSENNAATNNVAFQAADSDEAELALGTRGLVEGCDLAWDLAVPTAVVRTVRPPLVGQSDENFRVVADNSQQLPPPEHVDAQDEPEEEPARDSTQDDRCPNEAVGLIVLEPRRDRDKFLKESNYQLVLVNKDLLQMSSPEPSCGESDLAAGNGAEGHAECRLSSPSVVSGSSRLEWDSGADVGYGGPRVIYGLSTLERMAIGSYASVLRMEPEGTSSLCRDKAFQKGPSEGDDDTSDAAASDDTDDDIERTRRSLGFAAKLNPDALSFHRSLPAIPKHDRLKTDDERERAPKSVSLTDLNLAVSGKRERRKSPRDRRDAGLKGPDKVFFPSSSGSTCTITVTSPFCSTAFGVSVLDKPFYETPGKSPVTEVQDGSLDAASSSPSSPCSYSRTPAAAATSEDGRVCSDGYPAERMKELVSDFVGDIFRSAPAERKMKIARDLLKIIARNHQEVADAQAELPREESNGEDIVEQAVADSPRAMRPNSSREADGVLRNSNSTKTSTSANSETTNPLEDTEVSSVRTALSGHRDNFPLIFETSGFRFDRPTKVLASKPRQSRPYALWEEQRASRYFPSGSEEESLRSRGSFRNKALRLSSPSEMTSDEISVSQSRSRSQTSSKDTVTSGSRRYGGVKPGYNLRGQDVEILKGLVEKQRHMHIRRLEQEVQWLERIENILTVNTGGFSGLKRLVGDLRDDRVRVRSGDARKGDRRWREKKVPPQSSHPVPETVRNFGQTFPSPVPVKPAASVAVQTSTVSSVKSQNRDRRPVVSIPVSKTKLSSHGQSVSGNGVASYKARSNRNHRGGASWFLPFGSNVTRSNTLQEAFVKNKKDVMSNVEARQSAIADNWRARNERPKLSEDEAVRFLNGRRKMRVYTKPLQISEHHHQPKQRQFTHRQIRENTEKLYRDLAEVVSEEEVKRREETNRSNRLMANIFKKRLLENVLKGKVSYGLQSLMPFAGHK